MPDPGASSESTADATTDATADALRDMLLDQQEPPIPLSREVLPDLSSLQPVPSDNLLDRAVALTLDLGRLGTRRTISTSAIEVDADKSMVHAGKDILSSIELKDITRHDGETRRLVAALSLPSLFKSGTYLVPIDLVEQVDALLGQRQQERNELIEKFIVVYPAKVEEARSRLAALFDPQDYPSVSAIRRAFEFGYRFFAFTTPTKLQGISKALFQREAEKAAAWATDAKVEIQQALRQAMAELVEHLVERLSGDQDGKPKIFKGSTISNLQQFLDGFAARDITNDAQLRVLVGQARDLVGGLDPDTLRVSETARDKVRGGFETIKAQLDGLMIAKPARRFLMEDDAPAPDAPAPAADTPIAP